MAFSNQPFLDCNQRLCMIFNGISVVFSTENSQQYETIGSFWDCMAETYGLEKLRGLGYNWTSNTIEYAIGLKTNEKIDLSGLSLPSSFDHPQYKEISLPNNGWQTRTDETQFLSKIYDEIYLSGPLLYEIETFTENGKCQINFIRK